MIRKSQEAKYEIIDLLRSQGYATYARLLNLFDFYFTDDDNVIAYMIPQKAAIVMNEKITDEDTVSMLVRHEILHEYLTHLERQIEFEKNHPGLKPPKSNNRLANIAADFEISNLGYTDADKIKVRNVIMGDKVLSGLVTEDENPDWVNMTFEEMYEEILKRNQQEQDQLSQALQNMGDLSEEDIQQLSDQIDQLIDELENQQQQSQSNNGSGPSQDNENSEEKNSSSSQGGGDQSDKEEDSTTSGSTEQAIDKLDKAQSQLNKISQAQSQLDNDGKIFDNKQEGQLRKDIEARAQQIKEIVKDIAIENNLIKEVSANKIKQKQAKASAADARYRGSGLRQFTLSLNRYIKNEIESGEDLSYKKPNASYSRTKFLIPSMTQIEGPIPLINVYHDVSGSFSDEAKTAAAMQAIATLNKYVREGKVKIKYYYFADRVSSNRNNAGGGTEGTPIIEHIESTKPQNVIVITDSDINDISRDCIVPGAVWMLFYGSRSDNLINHLKGRKETRWYMIDYR